MSDPWRYCCPEGHVSIQKIGDKSHSPDVDVAFVCRTCRQNGDQDHYDFKIDRKTGTKISA